MFFYLYPCASIKAFTWFSIDIKLSLSLSFKNFFRKMERSMRLVYTALVLLLLLVAAEMGPNLAEARTCESQSRKFKGACVQKSNCANVCHTEGFQGGQCRGFRRRCFCTKHC